MRALAALYREMAEELENSGLFDRRILPLDFAGLNQYAQGNCTGMAVLAALVGYWGEKLDTSQKKKPRASASSGFE